MPEMRPLPTAQLMAAYAQLETLAASGKPLSEPVSGMSPSTFAPDDPITRAQLAVILYNYTKQFAPESLTETGSLAGFPDAGSVPSWARTAMAWAVGNGLISGVGENGVSYLRPEGCATRAQVATILMNYDKALG